MKPVVLHTAAADEITTAIEFYDNRQAGLGDEFEQEIARVLDLIGKQPRAFTPYKQRFRKCVLDRFPYVIYFAEFDTYVWVPVVMHTSRKPDYWTDRQPE